MLFPILGRGNTKFLPQNDATTVDYKYQTTDSVEQGKHSLYEVMHLCEN